MTWWMFVLGLALVLVAVHDAVTTTISVSSRSGPLTTTVNRMISLVCHRGPLADRELVLRSAGPASVVLAVLAWILALWAGWALLFSSDIDAVVSSTTDQPVDGSARWLFAAYTIYTLGYGNYLPTSGWEIPAAIALIVGFALLTLSVTYAIPVVSAVTDRRQQGSLISTAGTTPGEIVTTLHDASGFSALEQLLHQLTPALLTTAQRHLAYPVLHNFLGRDRTSALGPSVVALDDATTMVCLAAADGPHLSRPTVVRWRAAVDLLLDRVAHIDDGQDHAVPPLPPADVLDALGVERVDDDTYRSAMGAEDDRRRRLHAYVRSTRWGWPGA